MNSCFFKIHNYPGMNATYEQMWAAIQTNIPTRIKEFLDFAQNVNKEKNLFFNDRNSFFFVF